MLYFYSCYFFKCFRVFITHAPCFEKCFFYNFMRYMYYFPMVVCLWFYAHGDALMEWWCLAIIIADKEILQNIADISPVMCSWLHAHGDVPMVMRPWWKLVKITYKQNNKLF